MAQPTSEMLGIVPAGVERIAAAAATFTVAALLLCVAPANPAGAASTCYDESSFPAVFHLERRADGLRIVLGSKWWKGEWWRSPDEGRAPAMSYDRTRGWAREADAPIPWKQEPPACAGLLPPIPLSVKDAILMRPHIDETPRDFLVLEQQIGACQQVGDVVWFGIAFYEGEGYEGVGGVGRYDLETKQLEVRRPELLRDASVSHLVHDGESLWLATHGRYECSGYPPVSGLIQYEWDERRAWKQSLCGFAYHGMVLLDGELWVASDLGLARARRGQYGIWEWENFVPTIEQPELLQPVTCDDLYTKLLESLPRSPVDPGDRSPWSTLFRVLAKHRPDFIEKFVLEQMKRTPAPDPTP